MADDTTPAPWEKDGEDFDAEKAKRHLSNLLKDKQNLQDRLQKAQAKSRTGSDEVTGLRDENVRLKIQMATGLTERQVARLVGDTFEEKMADAEAYAEETGIELRSFYDSEEDEGTPDEGQGSEESNEDQERKPSPGTNYRAPAQQTKGIPEPDMRSVAEDLIASM